MNAFNKKAQATQWVIRNLTAHNPEQHQPDFHAWLAKDPRHPALYDAQRRRWEKGIDRLRASARQNPQYRAQEVIKTEKARMARVRRRTHMAAALCFVGVAVAVAWFHSQPALVQPYPWVTYRSQTAQMDPVSLEDGTVVLLSTHSHLRVSVTDSDRRAVLDSGEVFFDVNPDAPRSFDVEAGSARVRAMDTAFSVKKDNDGRIEAAVKRGVLEVKPADSAATRSSAQSTSPEIKAGEVVTIGPDGKLTRSVVGRAELADRLSWTNPLHTFERTPLKEAVALFNRYNTRKLEVTEPGLNQVLVGGTFHLAEPEKFVESLEYLGIDHVSQDSKSKVDSPILLVRK